METKLSFSCRRVPIGARLLGRLKPLGVMRLWLLVMLLGWSSSAFSWYRPDFTNQRTKVDINGKLHYQFDFSFYVADGSGYYYDGEVWLKVDGTNLCKLNEIAPMVGVNNSILVNQYYNTYKNIGILAKQYTISGVTNVYVTVGNLRKSDKVYYAECDVCFERNYMEKSWNIGFSGYWHYNAEGKGETVNRTVITTENPSAVMPSITRSNFTRSNKRIELIYPAINTNYSGWSNTVMLYKLDCKNKSGVASNGTFSANGSFASNNYEPVTVYPRFEFYKGASALNSWGTAGMVRFDKDYGAITIPGLPRAKNVDVPTSNTYSKEVTLTWERDAHDSNSPTDGKWVIFRQVTGHPETQVWLGDTNNDLYKFTDQKHDLEYGTQYTYTVCYCPNGWTLDSEADAEGLSADYCYTLTRDFAFSNVKAEVVNGQIVFSWNHNKIKDASSSTTYTLYVQRSTDGGTTWETVRTDPISSSEKEGDSYTDADVVSHKQYKYRLQMNVQEYNFKSDEVSATITEGSALTGFSASQGNYTQSVKLTWTVNQVGTSPTLFILQRRPLGSNDESDWVDIYSTSGTSSTYVYEDQTAQPGSFNEYRLRIFDVYNGTRFEGNAMTADGFCIATGVVGGRITYGSGMAVKDVKVTLNAINADGNAMNNKRSIKFDGSTKQGFKATMSNQELKKIFGGDFTVQMWVNPDLSSTDDIMLFSVYDNFMIYLKKFDNGNFGIMPKIDDAYPVGWCPVFPGGQWSHLSLVYSKGKLDIRLRQNDQDWLRQNSLTFTNPLDTANLRQADGFMLGNKKDWPSHFFSGYVDEFRIFNRALTDDEIAKNYNHTLTGSEEGLVVYWPFDEGIDAQTVAYDFSKKNGISNGHHGKAGIAAHSEASIVPSEAQLSLMAYTDQDGNYSVAGIPFSGEGTSYTINPKLGEHKFNPTNEQRFINMNALVHSGVNFEDVSSFPVSGVVYYENTSIPVADATLKIDGITASRDGKAVTTNSKGEFNLSVPIGDHFISVEKMGHTFINGGRYPDDPDGIGTREPFQGEVTGLTFYDNTLVTVAGRVAGGDIEYDKPIGLNQGHANIGKAVLTLEQEDNNAGFLSAVKAQYNPQSYDMDSINVRDFGAVSGSAIVPVRQNYIEVQTDPQTGEFVVQLPPLRYKVSSVSIPKNSEIHFTNLPIIDATNPSLVYTDSVETGNGVKKFEYVGLAKIKHKEKATFTVTENEDGSFGIKNYTVREVDGTEHQVTVYEVKDDGIHYTFDHPVYEEMSTRTYHISAKEVYKNLDGGSEVTDVVPLAGKRVTVQNPFATTAKIVCTNGNSTHPRGSVYEMENNTFELDSLGLGEYNFTVGYPNIQKPYTRGLTITYYNDGAEQDWEGNATPGNAHPFEAYILGALPTGNNFVTQGPDHIAMVLRDPPGSGSYATWKKGSTWTTSTTHSVGIHSNTSLNGKIYLGGQMQTAEGIGFMVIQDLKSIATVSVGAEINQSTTNSSTTTTTITATRDISTSGDFDYNGADGDLFIGSAKNIIFGACHYVDIMWDDKNNKADVKCEDGIATGEQFTTGFNYTQNYVKNILIPNFIKLRNDLLEYKADVNSAQRPATGDPIYVTNLMEDDPKYGTSNNDEDVWGAQAVGFDQLDKATGRYTGPSYTMILPQSWNNDTTGMQDMVNFYNVQIAKWENELRKNEEAKVTAIKNKDYLIENHSFDSGASISVEKTIEESTTTARSESLEINAIIGEETGFKLCGVGLSVELMENAGTTINDETETTTANSSTFGYTLLENGDDDYLTVDVFTAPDNFGPIFYTRGGATSCPYQDEVVTEYYEPGTVIMQKTVQIEKPEIEAQLQSITGIPAGGKGTFKVNIRNNSDTKEDGWYDISVVSTSNPDGLVVKMDGSNITTGRSILIPAGETMVKTFTVEQSNPSVMDYRDVKIRIASQCQKDNTGVYPEIADTTSFSAFFQPACSDVHLAANHNIVNTNTRDDLVLSISGYNYSMETLEGIRLQYKGKNDADFTTLHEYIKGYTGNEPTKSALTALTGTSTLDYIIDLRKDDFADKTYVFRAITVCQIGGEVNNESEEVEVIRDMSRPQLIATPTPASGILGIGDDLTITFNEDIQGSILTKPNNFSVVGELNETEVVHEVALSLTGQNAAKTDGTIDLAGKSFSTSMWVNYSTDGTLLQHGIADNGFKIAIEGGKLAVSIGDKKVASTATLPANKWMYLNVSYDAQTGTVSAGYAQDASTVTLIADAELDAYEGNGPVALGGNDLTAKVQELTIWNDARSMDEALDNMYTTKSQFTNGLMGYWQLNEGHGEVATDKARSRNLTLPSQNAWWINGDNYAMTLDGTKAAAVDISTLNTTANDDYLVEAWFKADESNNAIASVLSTQVMDLRLNAQGKMELVLNNSPVEVMGTDLRDGQWHHVAVNVLKSTNGSGIIYVDGQQRKQFAASAMPALYGEKLMLGSHRTSVDGQGLYTYDQMLKGAIDEVRIWNGRRTADVIKNNMYQRVKSDETGLVAYYPMERFGYDQYNQIVTTANIEDATESQAGELSFFTEGAATTTGATTKANTAALKMAPRLTSVEFDFVASERQIKVNLNEQPYKMEGCNIYITAKNVKDVYGNAALPITWCVYVQQNTLKWLDSDLEVTKEGAQEATFTATIENRGAQSESWSLSGMPTWLSTNVEGGILTPLATQKLNFTVAGSLPIGTYETTVYLTGSQGINAPLNITVTSEGDAPDWVVTPGENTMTIVGVLEIDGVQSSDPKDMVAAFRGTECVGLAKPQYMADYDAYMLLMNIYGNNTAALKYKAYDASTGIVYPSVNIDNEAAFTFVADAMLGDFDHPVVFTPTDEIEQDLSYDKAGWKWFSLYAQPKVNSAVEVFKDAQSSITAITGGSNSNTLISWVGSDFAFNYVQMYKLEAKEAYTESLIGKRVDYANTSITLNANGWTWLGYPCQATNSLDAAFTSASPQNGDIVKGQSAFSIFTSGRWVGSLTAMTPGVGYMYMSKASDVKTFTYPTPTVSGKLNAPIRYSQGIDQQLQFKDNMTMVAVVMNGDEVVDNAQVRAFAGTELRGFSGEAVVCDDFNRHFLTIGGQNGELITYVVTTEGGEEYYLSQADIFAADSHRGTIEDPFVLQLTEATGIDMMIAGRDIKVVELYDGAGRMVESKAQPGRIYTAEDLRSMRAGVYLQRVVFTNGESFVQKLTK